MKTEPADTSTNRRHRWPGRAFLAGAVLAGAPFLVLAREDSKPAAGRPLLLPYESRDKTLGVVSCASSLCHGSIAEWQGSNVLQNEYVTWQRVDKHAGAARTLLSARSQEIARKLGLAEPASRSKVCLDCHAHNAGPEATAGRARVTDGVSCEACHGPAERWIASHSAPGATHAQNVANGLYPADRPLERARLCLSCHFGNADRFVSHRMMGAGHPRLSFELETFSQLSSHSRVDADYEARKGPWNGAKVWAIGQALAVAETMKILTHPARGRDGLFPELVLFDCHACHHPMSQKRWTPTTPFGARPGPGTVRLNEANLVMLRAVMRELDPAFADSLSARTVQLQRAAAGDGDVQSAAQALEAMAAQAAERIASDRLEGAALRGVALRLVEEGLAGHYTDYAAAEQAVMGIGSVLHYMNTKGLVQDVGAMNRGLRSLRDSLSSDENYRPAEFLARLQEFRRLIEAISAV